MDATTELEREAKALLRAVPEVAVDREWITRALLEGKQEGMRYSIDLSEHEITRWETHERAGPATCSEIVGCCAVGYVQLTAVCANGWDEQVVDRALYLVADALIELGWAEPVLRAYWEDQLYDHDGYFTRNWPEYGDWRDAVMESGDYDAVGEGLVPEWNDHYCRSKEEVLEVIAMAAA